MVRRAAHGAKLARLRLDDHDSAAVDAAGGQVFAPGETVPPASWLPEHLPRDDRKEWHEVVRATAGRALIPPQNWRGEWTFGEYQQHFSVPIAGDSRQVTVLTPLRGGANPPAVSVDDAGVLTVGAWTIRQRDQTWVVDQE